MHEPVWNGGNPYFSIRTDRVDNHLFIRCDYKDRYGNLKYPNAFHGFGDEIRGTKIYKERWGKAYRVYLSELEEVFFHFTIAWDGYDGKHQGEITHIRTSYEDMVESIDEYLQELSKRDAYLECCSMEAGYHVVDLTNKVTNTLTK